MLDIHNPISVILSECEGSQEIKQILRSAQNTYSLVPKRWHETTFLVLYQNARACTSSHNHTLASKYAYDFRCKTEESQSMSSWGLSEGSQNQILRFAQNDSIHPITEYLAFPLMGKVARSDGWGEADTTNNPYWLQKLVAMLTFIVINYNFTCF